jgi:hypothetical protein
MKRNTIIKTTATLQFPNVSVFEKNSCAKFPHASYTFKGVSDSKLQVLTKISTILRATGGKGALMRYYCYYRAAGHKSVIKGTVQRELRGSKYVLFSFLYSVTVT